MAESLVLNPQMASRITSNTAKFASNKLPFLFSSKSRISTSKSTTITTSGSLFLRNCLSLRRTTSTGVVSAVSTAKDAVSDSAMDAVQRRLMFEDESVSFFSFPFFSLSQRAFVWLNLKILFI